MSAKFTRPYVDAFFAVAKDPAAELAALEAFRHAYDRAPELGKVLSNPASSARSARRSSPPSPRASAFPRSPAAS